ncbi:MAG: MBOAT family O-acyltransferase [Burkholderiales bacterium]
MLFNSFEYIALLASSLGAYWLSPSLRLRQWVVLVASVYFYMSWSRIFIAMLLLMIGINWLIGKKIGQTRRRFWLVLACVFNLGLLAYFKYMNFFLENVATLMRLHDPAFHTDKLSIILPLGISFYVFELISYQVDIYRGKFEVERDPIVFAIFVLFFPHLIAGPICRAEQFMPQVHVLQGLSGTKTYNGLYMFLAGFALKCGIADGVAPFVNVIFSAPAKYSGFDNLMAVAGFGIQILCDFWGYSLMALGSALLFGYALPHNFNLPYAALSIRAFWRRWHMTLSDWLRDYLYVGLGGSRTDKAWKVQRNLALTMFLGGLWHGASWTFIVWGIIHGGALVANRWFEMANVPRLVAAVLRWPPLAWLLTMATVFVAWIFFRASHFEGAIMMLRRIVMPASSWSKTALAPAFFELLLLYLPLQWLVHITTYDRDVTALSTWKPSLASACLAAFCFVYYVDGNEFIYFQF